MKNIKITQVLAALIAVSLPVLALAQLAGASLPFALNAETLIGGYSVAFLGVLAISDYSRRTRIALKPAGANRSLGTIESHRLAA